MLGSWRDGDWLMAGQPRGRLQVASPTAQPGEEPRADQDHQASRHRRQIALPQAGPYMAATGRPAVSRPQVAVGDVPVVVQPVGRGAVPSTELSMLLGEASVVALDRVI